jgi:hypothetical protein
LTVGLVPAGVVVGLGAAGCGQRRAAMSEPAAPVSWDDAERALRLWARFPVEATPRPIVLTSSDVEAPRRGFPDGETKLAFVSGAFDLPGRFPDGPGTADGYRLIGAKDAAAALLRQGNRQPAPMRLAVTAVRLGSAEFGTDRGRRTLPAWLFSLPTVADPAAVLAVAPPSRFVIPGNQAAWAAGEEATVGRDRTTIAFRFVGSPPGRGPCEAQYAVDAFESRTAVAVSVRQLPHPPVTGNVACPAVGYLNTVSVRLAAPLGARILVAARSGAPIPVQQHG